MDKLLLDLGEQPIVNNLCKSRHQSLFIEKFPLRAKYNEDLLIHLDTEVPPDILYKEYFYRSGINIPYIKHCENIFETIKHLKSEVIIDIGGNDGTLLNTFKRMFKSYKMDSIDRRFINVDASESFLKNTLNKGIEFKNAFFSSKLDLPKADIITSTNVFQHTKNVDSFLKGITKFLNGVWILEFPYTLTTLNTMQFDQFYHEHYYYWLLTPIVKLFEKYNLKIIHISQNNSHGGSLRIWSTNQDLSSPKIESVINEYKLKEQGLDLNLFNSKVKKYIKKAKEFILNLEGKTVFFGAAAKGCVFLNALGINIKNMPESYIVDDTLEKTGLFFPGTGFEICNREKLEKDQVKNIIILAHNFKDYIKETLIKKSNFSGKVYVMLPKINQL